MTNFYVTFGHKYKYLHDKTLKIEAVDEETAREEVFLLLGTKWSFLYDEGKMNQQIAQYGLTVLTVNDLPLNFEER